MSYLIQWISCLDLRWYGVCFTQPRQADRVRFGVELRRLVMKNFFVRRMHMKQSRVMRSLGLLVLAAMTLLPLTAGAVDLSADEGQRIAAGYGRGAGGYGPGNGTGDGIPDYDCDGFGPGDGDGIPDYDCDGFGLGDCTCVGS